MYIRYIYIYIYIIHGKCSVTLGFKKFIKHFLFFVSYDFMKNIEKLIKKWCCCMISKCQSSKYQRMQYSSQ